MSSTPVQMHWGGTFYTLLALTVTNGALFYDCGGDYVMAAGSGTDWGDVVGEKNLGVIMTPFLFDGLQDVYGITESDMWINMVDNQDFFVVFLKEPVPT